MKAFSCDKFFKCMIRPENYQSDDYDYKSLMKCMLNITLLNYAPELRYVKTERGSGREIK